MNYCESFCRTIQRLCNRQSGGGLLPAEYQQVEYIQSTGNNWIDTGISASSILQTTVQFRLGNTFSYGNLSAIFGAFKKTSNGAQYTAYSIALPSSTQARMPSSGVNFANTNITNISSGTHTLVYRFGYLSVDEQTATAYSGSVGSTINVYLFGRNNQDYTQPSITQYATAGLLIYHAQLGASSDAAAYRDLYPCYRKADNVTGMYDLINNEFIPYSGTANFITGNNV